MCKSLHFIELLQKAVTTCWSDNIIEYYIIQIRTSAWMCRINSQSVTYSYSHARPTRHVLKKDFCHFDTCPKPTFQI